jgi:uncharacterized protein YjbI with pentapeptide repeats
MKTYTAGELAEIIRLHGMWLFGKNGGARANLRGANLAGANLWDANLRGAKLWGANLRDANLGDANLWCSNLKNANLKNANLENANLENASLKFANLENANLENASLKFANLENANLENANLWCSNLEKANLWCSNLGGANLRGANLWDANLRGANLWDANLRGANLGGADLKGAHGLRFQIPQQGSIVGYKKLAGDRIAILEVPPDARRTATPMGRKCRAECALVIGIESIDGNTQYRSGSALRNGTPYTVGDVVTADSYDDDWRIECAHGIHFFLMREEAVEYP